MPRHAKELADTGLTGSCIMVQDIAMALVFGLGYAGIIFEESLAFNKSGVGLLMAVSLWVIRSIGVRFISIS